MTPRSTACTYHSLAATNATDATALDAALPSSLCLRLPLSFGTGNLGLYTVQQACRIRLTAMKAAVERASSNQISGQSIGIL